MTTLTLNWDTEVVEHHRFTFDPDHDGLPEGIPTYEAFVAAAKAAFGPADPEDGEVPQDHIDAVHSWLPVQENGSATTEDVLERSITKIITTTATKES